MQYRIEFVLSSGQTLDSLFDALAEDPAASSAENGAIMFHDAKVSAREPTALEWVGDDERSLFLMLRFYFDWSADPEAGVLMTSAEDTALNMIAITRDQDAEVGRHDTGVTMLEQDVLATEAVFVSVWPMLINDAGDDFEEFAEDDIGTHVVLDQNRTTIIAPLLGTIDDEYRTVSFVAIGTTAPNIMDRLLMVPEYVAEDPEYLVSELPRVDANLLAVSFFTDRGKVVEIRMPLQEKRVADAQALLAKQNSTTLNAELYYVVDIDDEQEIFHIQRLRPDGALAAPETLKLIFD